MMGIRFLFIAFVGLFVVQISIGESQFFNGGCGNPETTDPLLSRIDATWVCKNRITGCEMIFGNEKKDVAIEPVKSPEMPESEETGRIIFPGMGIPELDDNEDKTTPAPTTRNPVDEWTKLFPNFDFTNYRTISPMVPFFTEKETLETKTTESPKKLESSDEIVSVPNTNLIHELEIRRNEIPSDSVEERSWMK